MRFANSSRRRAAPLSILPAMTKLIRARCADLEQRRKKADRHSIRSPATCAQVILVHHFASALRPATCATRVSTPVLDQRLIVRWVFSFQIDVHPP